MLLAVPIAFYQIGYAWNCRSGHVERENFLATWEGTAIRNFPPCQLGRARPGRAEQGRAEPKPSRAGPSRAGPGRAKPGRAPAEPSRAGPSRAEGVFPRMLNFTHLQSPT